MGRRPTTGYANEEMPDHMPPANQGAIPVLVRLVDDELGEHYRPAEARRWTTTHVMVGLYRTDPDTGRRKDQTGLAPGRGRAPGAATRGHQATLIRTTRRPAPCDGGAGRLTSEDDTG
jgi:hypothetical protein